MGEIDWQRSASAGIAARSNGAEHNHGRRQRDGHDVSQENGRGLQERGTAAIRRMVPPQSGQMAKSAAVSGGSPLVRLPACLQVPVTRASSSRRQRVRLSPRELLARKP